LGGCATFASFSAETSNPGSTIASGTLTMSNTVDSGTACLSSGAGSTDNVNPACDTLLTLTNVAPGVYGGTAKVTVKNTGSIDASKLWVWAPSVVTTLTTGLTSGVAPSTLAVTALKGAVVAGQAVVVSSGAHTQTFYASSAAAVGATSIAVAGSAAANFSYPSGSTSLVDVADCYDAKTTSSPASAPGSTYGTQLNFNPTAGNPLCGTLLLYVQEITGTVDGTPGTQNYCWVGQAYSGNSMCVAPISVTLSGPLTTAAGGTTALPVTALNGNVRSGDKIVVASGTTTQTFSASADVYVGATSIPVTAATATTAFPAGSTVTHSTTDTSGPLVMLDANTTDTISNFDTLHDGQRGPIQLPPVTSNAAGATTLTQLPHGSSRTFLIGVFLPAPTGSSQNQLQGLVSKFGLTWHVDQ
jgi:hypothetical protein